MYYPVDVSIVEGKVLNDGRKCKEIDDIPSHLELDKEIEVDLEV